MRYLNQILILVLIVIIVSMGCVGAADSNDAIANNVQSDFNIDETLNYPGNPDEILNDDIPDIKNSPYNESNNLKNNQKVVELTESNFYEYFSEDGYVDTSKVSPYDTFDLSGNFSNIEIMIFTIPVTVTSTSGDAYLKDCTIQFDKVRASESNWIKVSNLKIDNKIASGFNGVIATYSSYIEITNNTIYSESAGGNPVRILGSNYINVTDNVLKTWYKSSESGFNASWTHSCIILGESHYNYIANNDIAVKESNPIYLSEYGCGPSNYNIIFNNTIRSLTKSEKTGLYNPSSWTYGVQIMGEYNRIIKNTIYNVYRGISTDGNYNEIIGNVIFNITGGYYEGNDGTQGGEYAIVGNLGSLIANNTVYDSKFNDAGSAIYVGPNNNVYGNNLTVTDSNAIIIHASSSNVNIHDNIINTKSGKGIYTLGHMNNVTIMSNIITSESGIGIQIKKQSNSKYPKNVYIVNNYILTSNDIFIDVEGVLNKSSLICENNTCKKIVVVTKENFFSYFDNHGNLKLDNIGILVFKGSFDSNELNVNSININQSVYILGNNVNIKNIQFNITSSNVIVENINFNIESESAIYLNNANNVSLIGNQIKSISPNSAIIVSKSFTKILSNKIQAKSLGILADYGSQIIVNNNVIKVTGNYTIDLTSSGNSSSDLVKNNISNNYLLGNLKGDLSVSYLNMCENNNIIYDNDGLISKLIVNDNVAFVNQNPMLVINLVDFDGNPIVDKKITLKLTNSQGQQSVYSVFTNIHGIALLKEAIPVGNYKFSAIYDGDEFYKSSQALNITLNVIYMDTSLLISNINTYYGISIVIKAILKGNDVILLDNKTISVTVNGKTYKNSTVNGVAAFNIGILPKGSYSIDYVFDDDENCTGSIGKANLVVNMMPTVIGANNVVMFYKDGSGVIAYLKDNAGKSIAGKAITIEINGKAYKKTTDKKGKVTLPVSLTPKTYSVSLNFIGDSNYKSSSKSIKVQVKTRITKIVASNLVKYYGDSKKLVIYLKDANNKAIAGKLMIIKINGKTYKKTTDKKGKVSLSLSLSKKTYKATIKFSAKHHKSSSKIVKVSVVSPKVSALSKNVKAGKKLNVVFKTYNGKVISGQKVYFKFKGKTYYLTTNSKGITTLTCNVKKGLYNVVAGFKSASVYGSTKTNIRFKVI